MPATYQQYAGTGVDTAFAVPFPYLDKSHVQVTVNGVSVTHTWLNPSLINISSPPAFGAMVEVRRLTPLGSLPVEFTDGSVLSQEQLDLLARYATYLAEEAREAAGGGMGLGVTSQWDAKNRRLTNLAPGVGDNDAVTVDQLNDAIAAGGGGGGGGQASILFRDEGFTQGTAGTVNEINFVGSGVNAMRVGNSLTIDIPGGSGQAAISFKDEGAGTGIPGTVTEVDFVGNGVTATRTGNKITVDIPGGGGGGPVSTAVKVAVIGDSMSAHNAFTDMPWPDLLGGLLNAAGSSVQVLNLAKNGWTFNKANSTATFGTKTMVQQCIDSAPNVIVVALGANDTLNSVEGRSIGQVQADASTLFTALRNALPTAKIIYASELMYDSSKFTPANLKNKGLPVYLWQLKTSGILNNMLTSECLSDDASSQTRTRAADWFTLDNYVKGLTQVNDSFTLPYFKAARLGLVGADNIHLTTLGQRYLAGAAFQKFYTSTALDALFPNLMNQDYTPWNDPDWVFTNFLTSSGDGYVNAAVYSPEVAHVSRNLGPFLQLSPDTWMYSTKGSAKLFPTSFGSDSYAIPYWSITNARPNTPVEVSTAGQSFTSAGQSTDAHGNAMFPIVAGNFAPASYSFRYRVGNEVFGPFGLTVTGSVEPKLLVRLSGFDATGGSNTYNTVNFNSVVVDNASGWSSGAGTYTVARKGSYSVQSMVNVQNMPDNCGGFLCILKNGGRWIDGPLHYNSIGGVSFLGSSVSATFDCEVGDVLTIQFFQFGGGSLNMWAGDQGTAAWLSIRWVGF